jgi:hypothetical protein
VRTGDGATTSPWLRRTPAAQAAWLEWTGPRRRGRLLATLGAAALAVGGGAWLGRDGHSWILNVHPLIAGGLGLAFATVTASARRARRHAARTRAWTGALPVAAPDARRAAWLDAAATAAAAGSLATFTLVAAGLAGDAAVSATGVATAIVALWLGLAAGVAYACLRRLRDALPPPPGSRYVPATPPRPWRARPSLAPLGAWPLREAFVRAQPRAAARAALPVLLLLPAGLSLPQAALTLAIATLVLLLAALLAGTRAAVAAALAWLVPAPLGRVTVARATARIALVVIGGATLVAVALGWSLVA